MNTVHVSCCSRVSDKKVDLLTINKEHQQCVAGVEEAKVLTREGVSVGINVLVAKFRPFTLSVISDMFGIAGVWGGTVASSCVVHCARKKNVWSGEF